MHLLYVKSMRPRVGGSVSKYIPYQAPKMELFGKIANCYFRKNFHLIFQICLKGFWIRLCITWKHKQSFKRKEKCLTSKLLQKLLRRRLFFSESAGKIWKFLKSLRQKINDFQYYDRLFSPKMPAVNSF